MPKKCPTSVPCSAELLKVQVRHRPRGWNDAALFLLNVRAAPPVGVCGIISLSSYVQEQFLLNIPRKPRVLALDCSSAVLSCFELSAFMFEFNPMSSTQSTKRASSSQHLFCTFNSWLVMTPTFCVMVGCTVFGLPSFWKQTVIAVRFCSVCYKPACRLQICKHPVLLTHCLNIMSHL